MHVLGRAILAVSVVGLAILAATPRAQAIPSFARQTGQPCGACHTDFPGLTPFGRSFKLGGYTLGGGKYRTTLFSDEYSKKPVPNYLVTKAPSATAEDTSKIWFPPISAMEVVGFTHTQAPFDPTGSGYKPNDNWVVDPVSIFWGGAFTDHIGAFIQGTYVAPGFGAPSDAWASKRATWDNTDIRYSNSGTIGDVPVIYGITANNNPSVQDPWNTTPAWGFPYVASTLAPGPAAATIIDGAWAAHVGGVGAYAYLNNQLYVELAGYQTVGFNAQNRLGTDPVGAPGMLQGTAPYWRVAWEPNSGNHYWMFGTFGMISHIRPWIDPTTTTSTFSTTDNYTDIGFDTQYQYKGDHYWLTLAASYITENQRLNSSSVNFGTNLTNKLNSLKAKASLAYGDDNKVILTGQYFSTTGSSDANLYAGTSTGLPSPNSDGYIAEIAYIPFGTSASPIWPWWNARIGLQYTYYNKFDGTTMNAHANNTTFIYLWFAQ